MCMLDITIVESGRSPFCVFAFPVFPSPDQSLSAICVSRHCNRNYDAIHASISSTLEHEKKNPILYFGFFFEKEILLEFHLRPWNDCKIFASIFRDQNIIFDANATKVFKLLNFIGNQKFLFRWVLECFVE